MEYKTAIDKSHPTWVRGLKPRYMEYKTAIDKSHPTWVRGLKPVNPDTGNVVDLSHPTWVRGLKLLLLSQCYLRNHVAPYVGAWIETQIQAEQAKSLQSRTLRGCVD